MSTIPPGWYDDQHGSIRWWDGAQWTAHVRQAPFQPPAPPVQTSTHPTAPPPAPPGEATPTTTSTEDTAPHDPSEPDTPVAGYAAYPSSGDPFGYPAPANDGPPPSAPPSGGDQPNGPNTPGHIGASGPPLGYASNPPYAPAPPGPGGPGYPPSNYGGGPAWYPPHPKQRSRAWIGWLIAAVVVIVGLVALTTTLVAHRFEEASPRTTVSQFASKVLSAESCSPGVVQAFNSLTTTEFRQGQTATCDTIGTFTTNPPGFSITTGKAISRSSTSARVALTISGDTNATANGHYIVELVKRDGAWKIASMTPVTRSDQNSNSTPLTGVV